MLTKLSIPSCSDSTSSLSSLNDHMNISSAKSVDFNQEFGHEYRWFGELVKKELRAKHQTSFSDTHSDSNECEKASGSSIFEMSGESLDDIKE